MGGLSDESMQEAEHWVCLPLVMLINFALFQYLIVLYYRRRSEPRVALLLISAFLGFATIVPQAYPDDALVGHLNDVSETCSVLTFLIQITMIGRDIERKVRIWSLKLLTYLAELLTVVNLLVVVLNFIDVSEYVDLSAFDGVDNIVEITSLVFVFFFRFFYITISRGVKWTLANKKLEIFLYVLFTTHELPWMLLESTTGITWEPVQAIWHRLTLMMCILMTIKDKMASARKKSKEGPSTGGFSKATSVAQVKGGDDESEDDPSTKRKPSGFMIPKGWSPKGWNPKVRPKSSGIPTATSTSRISSSFLRGVSSIRIQSLTRSVGPSSLPSLQSTTGRQKQSVMPGPQRP